MSEITLKAIEQLLDVKLDEKLDAKLKPIRETLDQHTAALDAIAKNTSDWNIEMTVMRNRMGRYEAALKLLAKKAGLDIKPLLH